MVEEQYLLDKFIVDVVIGCYFNLDCIYWNTFFRLTSNLVLTTLTLKNGFNETYYGFI